MLVALVFRVHHHRDVAKHRLRTRRGDRQRSAAVGKRIADVPHEAVLFLLHHFEVGNGGHQLRIPIHQPLAAVDQPSL
jgi:hypothetical protein